MITLGDIEEFPALDPIPVYPVNIDPTTNEVKVTLRNNSHLSSQNATKTLCKASEDNSEIVVIIGSGRSLVNIFIFIFIFFTVSPSQEKLMSHNKKKT